jgi:hypothetical protein
MLGLAPKVVVCTAMGATVHRRGHRHPMAVHRPIFPERRENGGWPGVAPPPPVRCHYRLSGDHG